MKRLTLSQIAIGIVAGCLANIITLSVTSWTKGQYITFILFSGFVLVLIMAFVLNARPQFDSEEIAKDLIQKTRAFWINPFLKRLSFGQLQVGMTLSDHERKRIQSLSAASLLTEIFEGANRQLMLLGDPGSGKTIKLVLLCKELVKVAELKPREELIPVVFNLSSWNRKNDNFKAWLAIELRSKYGIPVDQSGRLIDDNRLLLMLDGLDEVEETHRVACVRAINAFVQRSGEKSPAIVVSSRTQEYEKLRGVNEHLSFGELRLAPLDESEIERYLKLTNFLERLHPVLTQNKTLAQLSQQPLILTMLRTIFADLPRDEPSPVWPTDKMACEEMVFDYYLKTQLRKYSGPYGRHKVKDWIVWLARGMERRSSSILMTEHMQPAWLSTRRDLYLHGILSRFVAAMLAVLVGVLFMWFSQWASSMLWIGESRPDISPIGLIDVEDGLWSWVWITGGLGGLAFGVVDLFGLSRSRGVNKKIGRIAREDLANIFRAAINIAFCAFVFFLAAAIRFDQRRAIIGALIYGVAFGLVFWFRGRERTIDSDIQTTDKLGWSWSSVPRGAAWGLLGGLIIGLFCQVAVGVFFGHRATLYLSSFVAASGFLIGSFIAGLRTVSIEEGKTRPNQGVRMSGMNAIWIFLYVGLSFVLLIWAFGTAITSSARIAFEPALFFGLVVGLLVALSFCGLDVIYHYVLRVVLALREKMPLRWVNFLDNVADLDLLTQIGGGYVFYHPLLRTRLAADDSSDSSRLNKNGRRSPNTASVLRSINPTLNQN